MKNTILEKTIDILCLIFKVTFIVMGMIFMAVTIYLESIGRIQLYTHGHILLWVSSIGGAGEIFKLMFKHK